MQKSCYCVIFTPDDEEELLLLLDDELLDDDWKKNVRTICTTYTATARTAATATTWRWTAAIQQINGWFGHVCFIFLLPQWCQWAYWFSKQEILILGCTKKKALRVINVNLWFFIHNGNGALALEKHWYQCKQQHNQNYIINVPHCVALSQKNANAKATKNVFAVQCQNNSINIACIVILLSK